MNNPQSASPDLGSIMDRIGRLLDAVDDVRDCHASLDETAFNPSSYEVDGESLRRLFTALDAIDVGDDYTTLRAAVERLRASSELGD